MSSPTLLAAWLALASAPAPRPSALPLQTPGVQEPAPLRAPGQIPGTFLYDNVASRQVAFSITPIHPLEFNRNETFLFALNQPGAHLEILDPATLAEIGQVPIGIGATSVALRPGTPEVWVVDSIDSCVNVVDVARRIVVRTIRVGAEPHGIAFTQIGDRAYVTCAGVDRVDVIRGATYQVVKSIDIPAKSPRGIAYLGGKAWVVPFLSGNGSAPRGTSADPDAVETIGEPSIPNEMPLPDRDLFAITTHPDPADDDLDPTATRSGLGTILFNVHARPGTTELWIPNTDALNVEHRGAVNFVAGQFVRNQITIVDTSGSAATRVVDLDAIAPPGTGCGQPAYVAFDPVQPLAYVAGYANDVIAVLRIAANGVVTWEGSIELPPAQAYPRGTGPRACVVDSDRQALVTFNKNGVSANRIPIASLPPGTGWTTTAPLAVNLGHHLSPGRHRLGQHLFTNARFSASLTTSCASCHVDGHTDALVWDLSSYLDPEGTPDDQLQFDLDVKGPLFTQSVRRMEDSSPFHWRGERPSTNNFEAAFIELFEHTVNGMPEAIGPDFQYLRRYMAELAYPPNPRQALDRSLRPDEALGAAAFQTLQVDGSRTCASCHMFPTGASGEIVAQSVGGVISSADVPTLRGVADKLARPFEVGGDYGERSDLGAGLTHGGAVATLEGAFFRSGSGAPGHHDFAINALDAERIAAFLSVYDTGIAPAAGLMVTANTGNWAAIAADELPLLRQAAAQGDCELVARRVPRLVQGQLAEVATLYDPATGDFREATSAGTRITVANLLAEAASGSPVTFLGVPIGMGEPQGLDRDMDGLFDLDEIAAGTDPENPDTDGDRFADGYEILWGTNPLQGNATTPDHQPPALAGPVRLLYATAGTLKFEFDTNEFARVAVSYNGELPVVRVPLNQYGDHHHWVTLDELKPDTEYRIRLDMMDMSGNQSTDDSAVFRTLPRATAEPVHTSGIDLAVAEVGHNKRELVAAVDLVHGASAAAQGYQVFANAYRMRDDGQLRGVDRDAMAETDASGRALLRIPLPRVGQTNGTVYFVITHIVPPPGAVAWVRGLDQQVMATIQY